jgi:2-polyprenyl-3-methyl-5-hydroxy-6-metoxy-1,4-benzoquinol methylase
MVMAMTTVLDRTDALAKRLFGAALGALELYSVYLGAELGLYRALDEQGPMVSRELAEHAGIDPRYAREWLEQQAVAGLIEVEDSGAAPEERLYALSADHAPVLVESDDLAHAAPFAHMIAGIGGVLPEVTAAYRTGGGVPYEAYGRDFRRGHDHINRPVFTQELPSDWLAAMPDVVARLETGRPARVADLGCGQGWSSIAMAQEFLHAHVDGIDLDPGSIADARRNAEQAGMNGRLRFLESDAAGLPGHGPYDLILMLEVLHDLARPVEALAAARAALADGGTMLVVDERVADRFTAPGDRIERMMYGWSVLHCLPTQLVEKQTAATGTVMRADAVRACAQAAGFARVEVLPVENDFFRLYRLRPEA